MFSLSIFLFVAFLMLFLGGVVFVHDPRSRANRLFLVWVLFAVTWMVTNFLENVQQLSAPVREMFLRADFSTAILGAGFIYLFVSVFINGSTPLKKLYFSMLPAVALAALSFTPLLLSKIDFAPTGEIRFDGGPAYFFYAPALLIYFILPCIMLLRGRCDATPAVRSQRTSIAAGLIVTTALTTIINLFFQNELSADWLRVGIYAFLFFIIGVVWAIAKHAFLRIRFVVVEILLLGILATLLMRTILSVNLEDALINIATFAFLLILGFALIRSFLNEEGQRRELEVLAEQLESANAHLKEMDNLKNDFISIASHQLRTPITVIKGYLALMIEGAYGPLSDSLRERVANMNLMNERLVQMINNMLNVSRIEKNHIEYICAVIDLYPVIGQAVEEMTSKAAVKNISLRIEGASAGPVEAYVDMEKTIEVLSNLIDNSIKYSNKGSITVSAVLQQKKKCVVVTVADEGYGMNKEDILKVFTKFYRSSDPVIMSQGGTGLGLYVCAMFVRGMGGDIWIERSSPGKGTAISFALPTEPGGECAAPAKKRVIVE